MACLPRDPRLVGTWRPTSKPAIGKNLWPGVPFVSAVACHSSTADPAVVLRGLSLPELGKMARFRQLSAGSPLLPVRFDAKLPKLFGKPNTSIPSYRFAYLALALTLSPSAAATSGLNWRAPGSPVTIVNPLQ